MKNQKRITTLLFTTLMLGLAVFALAACGTPVSAAPLDLAVSQDAAPMPIDVIDATETGQTGRGQGDLLPPPEALNEAEEAALLFMREEEKLARDVYLTLYDTWGLPVFANIARSEQSHMDAVANLLDIYGLQDPAAGSEIGEFTNEVLQDLYDTLVAQGQVSMAEALLVGGAIEEIDIRDLDGQRMDIDNADITQVFENLRRGSVNHLNAFVSQYERTTGSSYTPQYLSQDAFDDMIGTSSGGGFGGGTGGGFGGGAGGAGGAGRGGWRNG